jgi:hypothetical protein
VRNQIQNPIFGGSGILRGGGPPPQEEVLFVPTNLSVKFGKFLDGTTLAGSPPQLTGTVTFVDTVNDNGIDIRDNDSILEWAFPNIQSLAFLNLINNTGMQTLSGFGSLTTFGATVLISGNTLLTSIPTFPLLTSVPEFQWVGNSALTTISGMCPALVSTPGDLYFTGHTALTTFTGFTVLQSVVGQIKISNSPNLTHLPAFAALTSVGAGASPLDFGGNALVQSEVDRILALAVALDGGTWASVLNLSGGTSAAPSAAGLVNKAILTGRGAVVNTN